MSTPPDTALALAMTVVRAGADIEANRLTASTRGGARESALRHLLAWLMQIEVGLPAQDVERALNRKAGAFRVPLERLEDECDDVLVENALRQLGEALRVLIAWRLAWEAAEVKSKEGREGLVRALRGLGEKLANPGEEISTPALQEEVHAAIEALMQDPHLSRFVRLKPPTLKDEGERVTLRLFVGPLHEAEKLMAKAKAALAAASFRVVFGDILLAPAPGTAKGHKGYALHLRLAAPPAPACRAIRR